MSSLELKYMLSVVKGLYNQLRIIYIKLDERNIIHCSFFLGKTTPNSFFSKFIVKWRPFSIKNKLKRFSFHNKL